MNSMMLIAGPYYARRLGSAPSLDAGAAGRSHHRRVHRAPRQDHPVAGLQLEPPAFRFQRECDRAVDAVQHLLVAVTVSGVAVAGAVRPRVAVRRLGPQLRHQLVMGGHGPILRLLSVRPRFLADCNVGRLARWLRALGYDASYHARIDDGELVREAAAESRVLLTRDRDLTKRRIIQTGVVRAILIRDDDVTKQLRQVF